MKVEKQCQRFQQIGQYQIIKRIGKGLTAQVYEARNKKSETVCLKIVTPEFLSTLTGSLLIQNEIKILSSLHHRNVIRILQHFSFNKKICLVTDLCNGGDLENFLKKHKVLQESQAIRIIKNVVKGCLYLNQNKILHRDIKPSNIFLHRGDPILADFGFSVKQNDNELMRVNAGSPLYMPYESLVKKTFSQKSDVFAVGVCLFEMVSGVTPYKAKSEDELREKLKQEVPKVPKNLSNKIKQILQQCLSFRPGDRPTFEQLLKKLEQCSLKPRIEKQSCNKENKFQIRDIELNEKKDNKGIQKKRCLTTAFEFNKKSIEQAALKTLSSQYQQKQNGQDSFQFIQILKPDQFTFLPNSIILKLKLILFQYQSIMTKPQEQSASKPLLNNYGSLLENDKFLQEVRKCSTEIELCRSIEAFVRRLLRLTKNYKQFKSCLRGLQRFYQRINSVIA